MELVYLWVDNYKNIKNQGFNFSPRFECEFDGQNLTIYDKKKNQCKNNDYIENFFGKNINITSIVGENGSGKTSILEMLFGNNIIDNCNFFYVVVKQKKDKKTIKMMAYKFDDTMSIYNKKIKLGKSYKLDEFQEQKKPIDKFSTLFYSTSPYTENMNLNSNIKNAENLAISEKETYLTYKLKSIEYTISMIKNQAKFQKLFELPEKITIGIKKHEKPEFCKKLKPSDKFIDKVKMAIICEIYDKRQKEVEEKKIAYIQKLNIIFNKIIEMPVLSPIKNNIENFIKEAEKIDKEYKVGVQVNINNIEANFINTYRDMIDSFFNLHIDLNILDFKLDKNLSTGQETYLLQFARLFNAMGKNNIDNNCIILVDEGENTLHPNWQKKYVKYLTTFLKDNFPNKNIHLIITSHSPFILSDLPKENVIFLNKFDEKETKEKYPKLKIDRLENGNCINVTKHIELKTFGENIHTLLSNGFFMRDGLMGEFAKSKIMEILDFLNDKEELKTIKKKQIKFIIESIGENFLRKKLLNLYRNKFIKDEKEKEKQILENKIEELQKQLRELNE